MIVQDDLIRDGFEKRIEEGGGKDGKKQRKEQQED